MSSFSFNTAWLVVFTSLVLTNPGAAQDNAQSRSIEANSNQTLVDAVQTLSSKGGVIQLKPGDYGKVLLQGATPSGKIRLVAADPSKPPVFRQLSIKGSNDIEIEGVNFEPSSSNARPTYLVAVEQGRDIRLARNTFRDTGENPAQRAKAVQVDQTNGISLEDNLLEGVEHGFVFLASQKINVNHNTFDNLVDGALNFVQCEDVVVTQNLLKGFMPVPGRHPIYINFLTFNNNKPSKNISISSNIMLRDNKAVAQGVFFKNDSNIFYESVVIKNNIIIQGASHGISVYGGRNVEIAGNLVVSTSVSEYKLAIRAVNVEDGRIVGNTTLAIAAKDSARIRSDGNTILRHYNKNFAQSVEERLSGALQNRDSRPIAGNFRLTPELLSAGARAR